MALIDNELWSRIHSKDESALAELYDNFSSAMFSLSYQILNDQWESEEVIQDIFSYIWRKPEAFSPQKGKFSSWLLVLTRNRSIDRYRSRKRRVYSSESDEISELSVGLELPLRNLFSLRNAFCFDTV